MVFQSEVGFGFLGGGVLLDGGSNGAMVVNSTGFSYSIIN